jgi:pimeloyl-ACP methyl ester carboxylesterase
MNGIKGNAIYAYCSKTGRQYTRFDYSGTGQSEGEFNKCNLSVWLQDALSVLDTVTTGKQLLVGSSMGGHLMLLVTLARQDRIHGLLGVASAIDFLPRIYKKISPAERDQLNVTGIMYRPTKYDDEPFPFSQQLFDDSLKKENRIMLEDSLPIRCPVRLIHGKKDEDIPWLWSNQLATKLDQSPDVKVQYIDDGDHRLKRHEDLKVIISNIEELLGSENIGYL